MRLAGSLTLALRFLGFGARGSSSNARKSLYGAMAGIAVSLVPLIVVLVVANGMIEGISARIIELSTSHLRLSDYAGISPMADSPAAMRSLSKNILLENPEGLITGAWAERTGPGMVIGPNGRTGATLRALEPEFLTGNPGVRGLLKPVSGSLTLEGPKDALLGEKLAEITGLSVGDRFRVLTLSVNPDGSQKPRFSVWTVKGIVSSGYRELDALWLFLPLDTGMEIMGRESSSTFVNVRTENPFRNLESVRFSLLSLAPEGFTAYTWEELNRSQFQSFNTTRTLLLFIMFLIVLVATVNVSSALVMLVLERRRDVAILKSCGTDQGTLTMAFLIAGSVTGLGGVVLGLPLGILAALHVNGLFSLLEGVINGSLKLWYILSGGEPMSMPGRIRMLDPEYYLQSIPVTLSLKDLLLIACGTLLLSAAVSLLPARRGAREKPIETLRKY